MTEPEATNLTLRAIIEFRDEMREFRTETRRTLLEHSHRLNVIEASLSSLKVRARIAARRMT
jgi:hypothetical protein